MIAYLKGFIVECTQQSIILDVHDVGYRVCVTNAVLHTAVVGQERSLYVHTHQRDDATELYGFMAPQELALFEKLLSVSGVGPKTALAALSSASVDGIIDAIVRGDPSLLRAVAGIGSKTAERIVVELKNSLAREGSGVISSGGDADLVDALLGLGYSGRDAERALRSIPADCTDLSDRLKVALKHLGGSS